MPERMDAASKNRMLDALDIVSDLVENSNVHPNEAIAKAAMEKKIPAGHVRLLTTAFNTGRANYHRKSASTVFEKTAPVPLADPDVVIEKLYPGKVKSAAVVEKSTGVSSAYFKPFSVPPAPKSLLKAASAPDYEPAPPLQAAEDTASIKRAFHELQMHKIALDNKAVEVEKKKQTFLDLYKTACDAVRIYRPANWNEIRNNFELAYGNPARTLLKHIDAANSVVVKNANAKHYEPLDLNKNVYKEIYSCLQAMQNYKLARDEFNVVSSSGRDKELRSKAYGSFKQASDGESDSSGDDKKKSYLGKFRSSFTQQVVPGMGRLNSLIAAPAVESYLNSGDNSDVSGTLAELNSPEHDLNMQNIQTKFMLHDLLANDEVLSNEDPAHVLNIFNDVQKMTPALAQNPSMVRAVLRKAVAQGGLDTHEYKQLAETENLLTRRYTPNPVPGLLPVYPRPASPSPGKPSKFLPGVLRAAFTSSGGDR